jgi:hypothetical protein
MNQTWCFVGVVACVHPPMDKIYMQYNFWIYFYLLSELDQVEWLDMSVPTAPQQRE